MFEWTKIVAILLIIGVVAVADGSKFGPFLHLGKVLEGIKRSVSSTSDTQSVGTNSTDKTTKTGFSPPIGETLSPSLGFMSPNHNIEIDITQNAGDESKNVAQPQIYKLNVEDDATVELTLNRGPHMNVVVSSAAKNAGRTSPVFVVVPVSASAKSSSKVDTTEIKVPRKLETEIPPPPYPMDSEREEVQEEEMEKEEKKPESPSIANRRTETTYEYSPGQLIRALFPEKEQPKRAMLSRDEGSIGPLRRRTDSGSPKVFHISNGNTYPRPNNFNSDKAKE